MSAARRPAIGRSAPGAPGREGLDRVPERAPVRMTASAGHRPVHAGGRRAMKASTAFRKSALV